MAASQFVIAGRADCEQYARLEAAADYFQSRLPSFRVYKEPQSALEWPCYLRRTCAVQGWPLPADPAGPLVWRLLVQRGGRGLLVGGLSEFLQLAALYYGLSPPEVSPAAAEQMAAHTANQLELERRQRRQARVALERRLTTVAVLGSPLSGAAAHFLTALAAGTVLGGAVLLRLQLLGDPTLPAMAALRWELQDMASPNLCQIAILSTVREAVRNASVIIVLDPVPNILPPEPPEPTPPPTPPPDKPPLAPAGQPPAADDTAREPSTEPATATTPPASPQISMVPSDDDRLPGDLPQRGGRGASARHSGDSRKLSVIMEDPDSEEKEEEEMEKLRASRGDSGRRGGPGSGTVTDPADTLAGGVNVAGIPGAEDVTATDDGAAPGQESAESGGSLSSASRQDGGGSVDLVTDADGWLEPPPEEDDSDVTQEELTDLFYRMRAYARAIDVMAIKRCRVVVAGGRMPCLAATVLLLHLPRLPRTNVIAVCQPRINQLRSLLAERLGVAAHDIHGLAEWGNPPAGRAWLDLDSAAISGHQGAVRGPPGYRRPLLEVLHQRRWLTEDLPRLLAVRGSSPLRPAGAEVSALPLAVCLADTLRRWWAGVDDGRLDSLGVASEGEFGVPQHLVFAAPVRLIAGDFRVCRAAPLYGEGATAVRSAVDQLIGWLWRFGVRLSASGYHCTLSSCASSTVTCCGSGERMMTDAEQTPESDEKVGDTRSGGAEGDGGGEIDGDPGSPPAAAVSAENGERSSERTGSAESGPRPGSAHGERTPIPSGAERRGSVENTPPNAPMERKPSAGEEETPASAGARSQHSTGSAAETDTPIDTAAPEQQQQLTSEGGGSSEEQKTTEEHRRTSLTAEGERGYIPAPPDL